MPAIAETLRCAERELAPIAGDDARIEAEALLALALGIDRAHLLARLGDALSPSAAGTFEALFRRRIAREPLAYIVGYREFYGLEVACTPAALIPRPETEMLVEFALAEAHQRAGVVLIADVGTGTGAIGAAIAVHAPEVRVTATDTSIEALALARENVTRHDVADRVALQHADLLDGPDAFDVIVANLPYISERDWETLPPEIRDHEPKAALVGGATGLEIIGRLLGSAGAHLTPAGVLAVEIGDTQGDAATAIARACFAGAAVCVMKDLAGRDRVLTVRT